MIYSLRAAIARDYSDLLRQAHRNRSLHLNIAPNVGFVNVSVSVYVCVCRRGDKQFIAHANPTKEWIKMKRYLSHSRSCKISEWNDELTHTELLI